LTVVTVAVVVAVDIARVEVEFPRVVAVALVERRRPVVAVRTDIVERAAVAVASTRQEKEVATMAF